MNRLFVKVTTDPKRKGTLLEVRGDQLVADILQHIVSLSGDLPRQDKDGKPIEYRLVRLGQPSTLLDFKQVFAKTGVGNGDTLLLQVGAQVWRGGQFFDFSPLAMPQEVSVQDLRAPLRLPVPDSPSGPPADAPELTARPPPPLLYKPSQLGTNAFEFEPLDMSSLEEPLLRPPDESGSSL